MSATYEQVAAAMSMTPGSPPRRRSGLPAELPIEAVVEYRDVVDFPAYRVGSDGTVWSKWQGRGEYATIGCQWRRLRTDGSKDGKHYEHVALCRDGRVHMRSVHRLVLMAFRGEPPAGCEVRHLDGDRYNNALNNLDWGTRTENMADMVRHGRSCRGERNGQAKLTEEDARAILALKGAGWSTARIARWLGESYWTIRNIVDGTRWGWIQ